MSGGARARHTVGAVGSRLRSLWGGAVQRAPEWVSGLLAGIQGALLSLLAVAVPALAAYVATSADPTNAETGWPGSVGIGAALWLMGHGAPVRSGEVVLSLVPLGVTLLAVFTAYASARRSAPPSRRAWLAGTVGYVAAVGVVLLVVTGSGTIAADVTVVVRTLVGALLVGGIGLGAGTVRIRRLRALTEPWWTRVDPLVRSGATAGTLVVAQLVGASALVTCAWVVSRRAAAGDVIEGLGVDTFGGLIMAVAQLALLPNLVLWVLAWLAGPGFSVGVGTLWSPAEVVSGPLPALPMLAALPETGRPDGVIPWAPAVVVLAGLLAGWWLHRRVATASAWHPVLLAVWAALTAGAGAAALTLLAGGAAGPGRLGVVGASALTVGGSVAVLSLAGMLLGAVPTDPLVRAALARGCRGLWARLRGRADVEIG